MSTIICGQQPLVLRKIDPIKIAADYKSGAFQKISLKLITIHSTESRIQIPKEQKTSSDWHSMFRNERPNHCETAQASAKLTNSTVVRLNRNSTITKIVLAKRDDNKKICSECGYSFTDDGFGIPIKMVQYWDTDGKNHREYTTLGNIDTLECAIKATKRISASERRGIDGKFSDSYSLLSLMTRDIFNISLSECKEAPPRELADINGGPLTQDEFRRNTHIYKPVINISIIHTPPQYLQV
jgi:hypothetical protein